MNFPKLTCPWIVAFLSITIATRDTLSISPTIIQEDPPFWQFVLREFVFKSISGPLSDNDLLYKKILEAPFYGGPFPEAFNDENALVSRGNVYHMPDGQWILCQEGCVNCDSCEQQKIPTVKWILRRVKRMTSRFNLPKWDLRLTVYPQLDQSARSSKHSGYSNDGYVTSQDLEPGRGNSLHDSSPASSEHASASEQHSQSYRVQQNDWPDEKIYGNNHSNEEEAHITGATHGEDLPISRKRSMSSARVKRFRVKSSSGRSAPFTFYYPQDEVTGTSSATERPKYDSTPRLIVGIDQHGEKHLVHVVPINSPAADLDSTNYRSSYKSGNSPRIGRKTQKGHDAVSYQKLIERIMDSLSSHRSFIEKFLFSDRLVRENGQEGVQPTYPSYAEQANDDDRFGRRNFEDYRVEDSPLVNQYSTNSAYQTQEQDDSLKRYADVSRGVNMPSGEYQDQMIQYEPYGISASDGQRDERSLAHSTDIERRRRNLFPKPAAPTNEHQELGQNHTEIDKPDTKFSMKRQLAANSTNHEPTNSRSRINETDASIGNSSEESATAKILIVN